MKKIVLEYIFEINDFIALIETRTGNLTLFGLDDLKDYLMQENDMFKYKIDIEGFEHVDAAIARKNDAERLLKGLFQEMGAEKIATL